MSTKAQKLGVDLVLSEAEIAVLRDELAASRAEVQRLTESDAAVRAAYEKKWDILPGEPTVSLMLGAVEEATSAREQFKDRGAEIDRLEEENRRLTESVEAERAKSAEIQAELDMTAKALIETRDNDERVVNQAEEIKHLRAAMQGASNLLVNVAVSMGGNTTMAVAAKGLRDALERKDRS